MPAGSVDKLNAILPRPPWWQAAAPCHSAKKALAADAAGAGSNTFTRNKICFFKAKHTPVTLSFDAAAHILKQSIFSHPRQQGKEELYIGIVV